MTMTEIRKEFRNNRNFAKFINDDLCKYYDAMLRAFETLYREGYIVEFDNDFLKFVNGYQINSGNYETLHVNQTLDLHSIAADKKTVKDMMITFLN